MCKLKYSLIIIIFSFLSIYKTLAISNTCGNLKLDSGEECEISNNYNCNNGKFCSCSCMCIGTCGNGFLGSNEECDDGNNINKDGCTENCTIEHTYCHEKCTMNSPWYIGGHVVNSAICPDEEFNEWAISNYLSCCCKLQQNASIDCKKHESGALSLEEVIKNADIILNNCPNEKGERGNPFKKHNIEYQLVKNLHNDHCGQTDCKNKTITLGICDPQCSTNLCAKAIHEVGHYLRCGQNKQGKFTYTDSCDYIAEEIIVQDESFSNCILQSSPTCNCEHERIYIIKQCAIFKEKKCKKEEETIKSICSKFI